MKRRILYVIDLYDAPHGAHMRGRADVEIVPGGILIDPVQRNAALLDR